MRTFNIPNIQFMPDLVTVGKGTPAPRQRVTSTNVAWLLDELGISIGFNLMTAQETFIHSSLAPDRRGQEIGRRLVHDMATRLGMAQAGLLDEILGELARDAEFHPMGDWMRGVAWDGVDRIALLAGSVTTDNELWPVFFENWLIQVVEAVCGWKGRKGGQSLPHVLVLVGGQGIGKTQFLTRLGGDWIKTEAELHLASVSGKDHQIAALKFPMVELSELDGIFRKSDIQHMNSFISRTFDEIRAPYQRVALERPRMTVFCGSVNAAEFLTDGSGSRRYWPVEVLGFDWGVWSGFDVRQLWAQACEYWTQNSDFSLTADEEAARQLAAAAHTSMSFLEEEITEYINAHQDNDQYPVKAMNRTDLVKLIYGQGRIISSSDISKVGILLVKLLGKHKTINGKQRAWNVPYNEFASDRATWPDKYHLKSVDKNVS